MQILSALQRTYIVIGCFTVYQPIWTFVAHTVARSRKVAGITISPTFTCTLSNKRPAQICTIQCDPDLGLVAVPCCHLITYMPYIFRQRSSDPENYITQFKPIERNKWLRSGLFSLLFFTHSNVTAYSWKVISCTLLFLCVC